jgi:hypothetical protein
MDRQAVRRAGKETLSPQHNVFYKIILSDLRVSFVHCYIEMQVLFDIIDTGNF